MNYDSPPNSWYEPPEPLYVEWYCGECGTTRTTDGDLPDGWMTKNPYAGWGPDYCPDCAPLNESEDD